MNALTEIKTEEALKTTAHAPMSEEFELDAITNNYSCAMNGKTILTFVYSENTGRWTRLDQVPGVVILSKAAFIDRASGYARSHERHSTTKVEIMLTEGEYVADMNRGGVMATGVWRVVRVGDGLDLKRIQHKSYRQANGNWGIKIPNPFAPRNPILLPSIRD